MACMTVSAAQRLHGQIVHAGSCGPVTVRLRLIGQMEAWTLTSESVLPAGRKTRALLAVVALSAPRPALRGRLAELLWSRRPEEQARASLRQEIHRLLEALSPAGAEILNITRDHLSLRPGTVWMDVEEVMRATTAHPASLSLLDGDLLEDLDGVDPAFDTWLTPSANGCATGRATLAEALLREQVEPEAAIPAAQQLLSIDRAHEGAWRALMRAHAARGERGMAIQAYERCRAVLADLLDAAPSVETQRLLAEIRGGGSTGRTQAAALPARPSRSASPRPKPAASRPEQRPSRGGARLGVMPLKLVGTSEEEAHLSPGLADEITTALARFRWMFLVSSNSLARFAAGTRDEGEIGRTFGLDFLLDGTIQKVESRLRITLRLLGHTRRQPSGLGAAVRPPDHDLLSLQDEIAAEVVAQIDPEILLIEAKRVAARPPHDPTAYDLLLRAIPLIGRMEREPFIRAGQLLEAGDRGGTRLRQRAWLVRLLAHLFRWPRLGRECERRARSRRAACRACGDARPERRARLDHRRARASFPASPLREAVALHERALSANPNLAMAWNLSGVAHAYLGDAVEAERRITRYKKLSPLDPHAFFFDTAFIIVALLKRDYEAAVAYGRAVSEMNPSFSAACKPYLAALGYLGQQQEAAVVRRRLLSIEPNFTIRRFLATTPFERSQDRVVYAEGLRRAGIPE